MPLDRRALLGTVLLTAVGMPALAAPAPILRVGGAVTAANYTGLEAFLFNSLDTVVGLKVAFPQGDTQEAGGLDAGESEGRFVAHLAGPGGESEIVADKGFSFQHGSYVFDGFFVVKSGGMNQGIISLYLDRADESAVLLSGVPITDIRIDRLDPTLRKQD